MLALSAIVKSELGYAPLHPDCGIAQDRSLHPPEINHGIRRPCVRCIKTLISIQGAPTPPLGMTVREGKHAGHPMPDGWRILP